MQHHNRAPGGSGSPLSECAGKIMLGQLRSAAIALDKQNNLITCQSKVTIIISFAFHRCHQSAMSPYFYLTQRFFLKKEKKKLVSWTDTLRKQICVCLLLLKYGLGEHLFVRSNKAVNMVLVMASYGSELWPTEWEISPHLSPTKSIIEFLGESLGIEHGRIWVWVYR